MRQYLGALGDGAVLEQEDQDENDGSDSRQDAALHKYSNIASGEKAVFVSEEEEARVAAADAKLTIATSQASGKRSASRPTVTSTGKVVASFSDLPLSPSLLRGLKDVGWTSPTPIQARMISIALRGRDVCASAVTGSGKTAAFSIPILERLVHRPRSVQAVRALIMCPTRELATQVHAVIEQLGKFVPGLTTSLLVGGLNMRVQEQTLRRCLPDVVVATPGRLLDHLRSTAGFGLSKLSVLVLDEADRLLAVGFQDELEEIVKMCPRERQTLLLSATMTEQIDALAVMTLHKPVRVSVASVFDVPKTLRQEFVRLRKGREADREALVLAMCKRSFHSRVILFVNRKRQAHRLRLLLAFSGLRVTELHGNMSQAQRLEALELFRQGETDYMVCTDVAARGLDLPGIRTVINYEMPVSLEQYIHRAGRTARAGESGICVTLVSERERSRLRVLLAHTRVDAYSRTLPTSAIARANTLIDRLAEDIKSVEDEEKLEKGLEAARRDVEHAENMEKYKADIMARPQRTWFQTKEDKARAKKRSGRAFRDAQADLDVEDGHDGAASRNGLSDADWVKLRDAKKRADSVSRRPKTRVERRAGTTTAEEERALKTARMKNRAAQRVKGKFDRGDDMTTREAELLQRHLKMDRRGAKRKNTELFRSMTDVENVGKYRGAAGQVVRHAERKARKMESAAVAHSQGPGNGCWTKDEAEGQKEQVGQGS